MIIAVLNNKGKHVFTPEGASKRDFLNLSKISTGEEKREFLNHRQIDDGLKKAEKFYLWTEKGTARHAKILSTNERGKVVRHD